MFCCWFITMWIGLDNWLLIKRARWESFTSLVLLLSLLTSSSMAYQSKQRNFFSFVPRRYKMPACCSLSQSNLFHQLTCYQSNAVEKNYTMADVCIVCEAFLQSCLENLLCDECRKPAEISLAMVAAIDEGVQDTPLHSSFAQQLQIMTFPNGKNTTSQVKRKLIF